MNGSSELDELITYRGALNVVVVGVFILIFVFVVVV
jgi:hypothetical protein